jgi:hypothetical protein
MNTSLKDFLKEIDANRKSFLEELEELVEPDKEMRSYTTDGKLVGEAGVFTGVDDYDASANGGIFELD